MASEQDARAALDRWRESRGWRGYSEDDRTMVDDGFLAGYEAGNDELRDRTLLMWDDCGGWIPGVETARLAAILGVPPERTLTDRQGGQSRPSRERPFIPFG